MKLSKDFEESEFACHCCKIVSMNPDFIKRLQNLRDILGRALHVNSGFRCVNQNKISGGMPDSMHLKGRAADISCVLAGDKFLLVRAAIGAGFTGIGTAKEFIHLDDREIPAIWTY